MRAYLAAVGLAAVLPLATALGQRHTDSVVPFDSAAASFVAQARAGTARYTDRALAIADGYRLVGPDLPAMGEHWLNIRLVLADTLDAAHPPVLIYVASPEGPVLAGAAYTRLLGPGDQYPDFPQGLRAWHEHNGFIEDEALPTAHAHHGTGMVTDTRIRLGIMHLWMGVPNPAGAWVADNWALPFVRAGSRPAAPSDDAGRALALAADSGRYYLDVLTRIGELDGADADRVRTILATAAMEARAASSPHPGLDLLAGIWRTLGARLPRALTPEERARLTGLWSLWW